MPAALLLAVALAAQFTSSWLALGTRTVTRDADRDTIAVIAAHGTYHAVKLTVTGSPVRFSRVVLHFENGEQEPHGMDELVPDGGQSRAIHLKGDQRAIRRIDFWYEAKSVGRKGAVVQLLGRS